MRKQRNLDIRDARLQSPSLSDSTDRDWRHPHGQVSKCYHSWGRQRWLCCQQGL